MRLNHPEFWTYRVVERFLLFPVTIGLEFRWLEDVYIIQEYRKAYGYGYAVDGWKDMAWATRELYNLYQSVGTEAFTEKVEEQSLA